MNINDIPKGLLDDVTKMMRGDLKETFTFPATTKLTINSASGDLFYGLDFNVDINDKNIDGEFHGEGHEVISNASGYEEAVIMMLFGVGDPGDKVKCNSKGMPRKGTYTFSKAEMDKWLKDYEGATGGPLQLEGLQEAKGSTLGIYVVYGAAGRNNGWAAVKANSKTEAMAIMRKSGWLTTGKVTGAKTAEEYLDSDDAEETQFFLDEIKEGNNGKELQHGEWVELEWGS